jgi:hypothetical protein
MIIHAEPGMNFYQAINKAHEGLYWETDYVDLIFNGIRIRVSKNSNNDDLATIYDLKRRLELYEGK